MVLPLFPAWELTEASFMKKHDAVLSVIGTMHEGTKDLTMTHLALQVMSAMNTLKFIKYWGGLSLSANLNHQ